MFWAWTTEEENDACQLTPVCLSSPNNIMKPILDSALESAIHSSRQRHEAKWEIICKWFNRQQANSGHASPRLCISPEIMLTATSLCYSDFIWYCRSDYKKIKLNSGLCSCIFIINVFCHFQICICNWILFKLITHSFQNNFLFSLSFWISF